MRLHHKAWESETLQYVAVMTLYPYIIKYFKFLVGHPVIHVGDACKYKHACLRMDDLKMFYRSTREVPSRAPLPSQPETRPVRRTCVLTSNPV